MRMKLKNENWPDIRNIVFFFFLHNNTHICMCIYIYISFLVKDLKL